MFVMWQEVVTHGGGGCCQMMSPGGTMRELGGGERSKERHIGEEKRSLYTTNRSPFPLQLACTRPPTVGDIDPGGAVNSSGMESVCCEGSRRGQPPDTTASVDLQQAADTNAAALLITTSSFTISLSF